MTRVALALLFTLAGLVPGCLDGPCCSRFPAIEVEEVRSIHLSPGACQNQHVRTELMSVTNNSDGTASVDLRVTEPAGLRWWPEALLVNATQGATESFSRGGWVKLQPHQSLVLTYLSSGPAGDSWTAYHLVYTNNNGPALGAKRILCPLTHDNAPYAF